MWYVLFAFVFILNIMQIKSFLFAGNQLALIFFSLGDKMVA